MNREQYKTSGLIKCENIIEINKQQANTLLDRWHYLGGLKSFTVAYGNNEGCCVFGVPRARKLVQNFPYKIIELVRMVGIDGHDWSMSSLMSKSVKLLKQNYNYDVIITYSDPHANHDGNTYRAANWIDLGLIIQDGHPLIFIDGISVHPRTMYAKHNTSSIPKLKEIYGNRLETKEKMRKNKFIYILNKNHDYLSWFLKV